MLRTFSLWLLLASLGFSAEKPNVIVILTDDQGWADIGYNNPKHVHTPNMDALAGSGVRFTNHYSMPQCTPTRVATFTGRYPGRFGRVPLQAANARCFPVGTPTMARMMKAAGYKTHLTGKWHMGSAPENGPNHHGFDSSYGSLAGAVGMYDHRYSKGAYFETWHRDHKLIPGFENGTHATDLIAREAIRVIQDPGDDPFFLMITFHAPHMPLDERGQFPDQPTRLDPDNPERWLNEDRIRWFNDPEGKIQSEPDPEKRLLLAAVNHLDHAIGEIVGTLEKSGKRENTLILYSSDNGPQVSWHGKSYINDLKLTDFNQPIPMRGSKCDVWEGGIHVPGFVSWPGKIEPGVADDVVHVIDWLPTLARLTGQPVAEDLDGTDLGPLLFERKSLAERDLYWIWNPKTNRWALRKGDWKIVHYGTDEPEQAEDWQLFNLRNDPKEKTNLANKHPEKLAELHVRFLAQRAKDQK